MLHPSKKPALKRLGPGTYADGEGNVHVSAREVLRFLGAPYTRENEEILAQVLRELSVAHGAEFAEVEARDGD